MRNFEVEETVVGEGAVLKVTAMNGLRFEDGGTVMEIPLMADYGPMIGEVVTCDHMNITVAQKRFDASHNLWVMDEDTKAWHQWGSK